MQPSLNSFKIGIYSLGLIGGSIYKSLKRNGGAEFCVCTRNQETINKLKADCTNASSDENILADCQIIFVCSPISKTAETIKKLHKINQEALYIDVSSIKSDITKEMDKVDNIRFIGSHPMAGTEQNGYDASFAELFEGAVWVLTPIKNSTKEDLSLAKMLVELMGATPLVMDSAEHDKAAALISHLPMLISQSLVLNIENNSAAKELASSGFRDTTRLAMSNKIMAKDMLQLNKSNIKAALQTLIDNANKLLSSEFFDEKIDSIIKTRETLYNSSGKNQFRNNG